MVDDELAYRAVQSRDTRFDGQFFTGVATTHIYCRPSCPARTPRRQNVHFFSTAAAAQSAGYRACKRCRPDESPGSPQWNLRADTAARAVVMVSDGVVDREGVTGLARRLGYSERQLRRHLKEELGVAPLELARARRSAAALALLENTSISVTDIAFAAGYASVRQFNEALRDAFGESPTSLRRHRESNPERTPSGTIELSLPVRQPYCLAEILQFLGARAVAGVEEFADGGYRRVLRLPRSVAIVSIDASQVGERVQVRLELDDVRDLSAAVNRVSQLLDLHADPAAISAVLERDPLLAAQVAANPGRRVPGHPDAEELAIRAVLGQQISVVAARNLASRLVEAFGEPLARPSGTLLRSFPTSAAIAELDPSDLPMPKARQRAVIGLARALAEGSIDLSPGADRNAAERGLLALPGIGGWTAAYVRMRGLGDPDALPAADLGVRRAFEAHVLPGDPRSVTSRAESWRPWRAYALMHLWASLAVQATPPPPHEREQLMSITAVQGNHRTEGTSRGLRFVPAPPVEELRSSVVATPIGDVVLIGSNDVLVELDLPGDGRVRHPGGLPLRDDDALAGAAAQLQEYFGGTRRSFDLDLAPRGTEFQVKVWAALAEIAYGTTATYGEIAAQVGNPKASRAVGMANNRNPIALIIPCHRVIGSSGKLVGYGGGLPTKEFLLDLERGDD